MIYDAYVFPESHGCSKAAIGAVALNTVLSAPDSQTPSRTLPANFSKAFFEAQASKIGPIWYVLS
jgi:hypothetical protein